MSSTDPSAGRLKPLRMLRMLIASSGSRMLLSRHYSSSMPRRRQTGLPAKASQLSWLSETAKASRSERSLTKSAYVACVLPTTVTLTRGCRCVVLRQLSFSLITFGFPRASRVGKAPAKADITQRMCWARSVRALASSCPVSTTSALFSAVVPWGEFWFATTVNNTNSPDQYHASCSRYGVGVHARA